MAAAVRKKDITEALRLGDWNRVAELALTACEPDPRIVNGPSALFERIRHLGAKRQEQFIVATLDGAHHIIDIHPITVGLVNRTVVHPREVFRPAILDAAAAIIVAHNHPSGRLEPSPEDLDITRRLCEAGEMIGINVLDHVVFSARTYLSMAECGLIPIAEP